MSDSPQGWGRIRSKSSSQLADAGSPPLPPLKDLELAVPALCEELRRGFEEAVREDGGPVDDPEDAVERPAGGLDLA